MREATGARCRTGDNAYRGALDGAGAITVELAYSFNGERTTVSLAGRTGHGVIGSQVRLKAGIGERCGRGRIVQRWPVRVAHMAGRDEARGRAGKTVGPLEFW